MIPPVAAPPSAPMPAPFSRVVNSPPAHPDPRITAPRNKIPIGKFLNRLSINDLPNFEDSQPAFLLLAFRQTHHVELDVSKFL
jgi:hypothetical protein